MPRKTYPVENTKLHHILAGIDVNRKRDSQANVVNVTLDARYFSDTIVS